MDVIRRFIEERCTVGAEHIVWADHLYRSYRQWCEATGERHETRAKFGTVLTEKGFQAVKKGKMMRHGLSVVDGLDGSAEESANQSIRTSRETLQNRHPNCPRGERVFRG